MQINPQKMNPNYPLNPCKYDTDHQVRGNIRYLDDRDFSAAYAYVLSNCNILKPYEWYAYLALLSHY